MNAEFVVGLTTYYPDTPEGAQRLDNLQRIVVPCLRDRLRAAPFEFVIADDDSPLKPACRGVPRVLHAPVRAGVGASLNRLFAYAAHRGLPLLYVVDDWVPARDLDVTVPLAMIDEPNVAQVRIGPPHPWVWGQFVCVTGHRDHWAIEMERARGGFIASHRPTFYDAHRWQATYGSWDENCTAFACEERMNQRVLHGRDNLRHLFWVSHPWMHIESMELADVEPR